MKRILNFKRKATLFAIPFFSTGALLAQRLKVTTGAQLETAVGSSATSATNIALIVTGAALAIALIVVVYKLAHGSNGAKEALIGWIVAVLVYGIAVTYVLTTT